MRVSHPRRLWGRWWMLPGALPLLYAALMVLLGDLRPEHVGFAVAVCALAYASRRTKDLLLALGPYLLTAMAYDALRYARQALVTGHRVLGCDLRAAELSLFGVGPDTTAQDWFALHHWPLLDLVCAAPYLAFAYVVLGYAVYLYVVDRLRMQQFLVAYTIGSFIGFVAWLAVPAAPPWYLRAYGCLIDLTVAPSPAGLLRVDAWLGIDYFAGFYSRAASVFGALPSMHCAFPLMGLLVSWRSATWRTRPIHLIYTLLMAFAAVYLDHHWVLDVLGGWLVAIVSVVLARFLQVRWGMKMSKKEATAPLAARWPAQEGRSACVR